MEAFSPFTKLPRELLPEIFRYLREWDLFSAALTCRSFADAAKPYLWEYTEIDFGYHALGDNIPPDDTNHEGYAVRKSWTRAKAQLDQLVSGENYRMIRNFNIVFSCFRDKQWRTEKYQPLLRKLQTAIATVIRPENHIFRLSINYAGLTSCFFWGIPGSLQKLDVTLVDSQIAGQGGASDLVPFPLLRSLKSLKLSWLHSDNRNPQSVESYPWFLVILCQALCSTPNLQHLRVEMEPVKAREKVLCFISELPVWEETVYRITTFYRMPPLRRLEVKLAPTFLFSAAPLIPSSYTNGQVKMYTVSLVFQRLLDGNSDIIEALTWFPTFEYRQYDYKISFPPFPQLKKLEIDNVGQEHMRKLLISIQNEFCQTLLYFKMGILNGYKISDKWLSLVIGPFCNLRHLRLSPISFESEPRLLGLATLEVSPEEEQIFAGYDLCKWPERLPKLLETIHLCWIDSSGLSPEAAERLKPIGLEWFKALLRLRSLKFTVVSNVRYDGDFVPQKMIFRRRKRGDDNLPGNRRCLHTWHLEPAHLERGTNRHFTVWSYEEIDLPGEYEGADGESWNYADKLDYDGCMSVKYCASAGPGACKHLIR